MPGCVQHLPDGLAGCTGCRSVWRGYERRRRARIAEGTWLPKANPATALEYIEYLRSAGLTLQDIADVSGVHKTTLVRLRRRSWLNGATEAAILAVRPPAPEPLYDPAADVDEVAVERVLAGEHIVLNDAELVAAVQAGAARGVSLSRLALLLGLNYAVAKKIVEGELPPDMAKRASRREVA